MARDRTPDPIDTDPDDLDAPIVVPAVIDSKAQFQHGGAIPATIVSDDRDTFIKRLTIAAFVVLAVALLGWLIKGEFDTRSRLHRAEAERNNLINSIQALVTDVNNNSTDLRAMRKVLERQNAILKAAGLTPATIPSLRSGGGGASVDGGSSTPRSQPSPRSSAPPSPRPSPRPSSHPSPKPSPTPVVQVCVPGLPCIRPLIAVASADWEAVHWIGGYTWRAYL